MAAVVVLALVLAWIVQRSGEPARPPTPAAPPAEPVGPARPQGERLWAADFETGGLEAYVRTYREGSGEAATVEVSTDVARTGRRAAKLVMPPSTAAGTVARLQLVAGLPEGREGQERWYGVSLYLGEDWELEQIADDRPLFLGTLGFRYTQTGARGPGTNIGAGRSDGAPVFSTSVIEGDEDVGAQRLGPVVQGRWVDVVVHVRWSRGDDGFREVWRDGVFQGRYEGFTLPLSSRFEHRMGVYQGTQVDHTRTLYWDNHRVGTGYGAVDPAR